MKPIKNAFVLLLTLSFFISCSKDDAPSNEEIAPQLTVQNLITTANENSSNGAVVGTVQAIVTEGNLSFSIENQSPAGALSINPSTGELTVANASLWDFEINPIITASVSVLSTSAGQKTAEVTVNLADMDDIAYLLSTSKTNYENAVNGTWVQVTEDEYNLLATQLHQTNRSGISETNYQLTPDYYSNSIDWTISHVVNTPETIPANSYFFAVKYYAYQVTNTPGIKVKLSTTANNSGFYDLPELPNHSVTDETVAFVLKGVNTVTSTTNSGYLGIFKYSGTRIRVLTSGERNPNYYFEEGDVNNLSGSYINNNQIYYQGLSSTQKQWD